MIDIKVCSLIEPKIWVKYLISLVWLEEVKCDLNMIDWTSICLQQAECAYSESCTSSNKAVRCGLTHALSSTGPAR